MAKSNRRVPGARRWGWLVIGLTVAAAIIVGAVRSPPVDGTGADRLYYLARQVKCEQCVGESAATSQSSWSVAARDRIQSQMEQGRTDDEILASFVRAYGQDVLLNPPSTGWGALVWVFPPVLLGVALAAIARVVMSRRSTAEVAPVSAADRELVEAALARRSGEGESP